MSDASTAVVQTCDAKYLPFALHLARQILHHSPNRQFDLILASETDLGLPAWALDAGIKPLVIGQTRWIDGLKLRHLSRVTYLRLCLPEVIGDRYRRILYLDSDMFFEGGDLDRLLGLPLGGHPLAAVTDIDLFNNPAFHAREYRALGLPALRYFNNGLLLMDSEAYRGANIFARCVEFARTRPEACILHDQSLMNGVLQGACAELAPMWNWQSTSHQPFVTFAYPIRFRHFIGRRKPWADTKGAYDARYWSSYADFFRALMPDALPLLHPRPKPGLVGLDYLVRRLIAQARARKTMTAALARFGDEWAVKLSPAP